MARPDEEEILRLVNAQAQSRAIITGVIAAQVASEVRAFTGWYSHPEIREWTARIAKIARAGQRQSALSTQTYTQRLLAVFLGRRLSSARLVDTSAVRGVELEAVYGRLADQYRYLRTTGDGDRPALPDAAVLDRVVDRAERQTSDNLDLVSRAQFTEEMKAAPATITGYRRVVHPELPSEPGRTPGPVCGLCLVASDRVYARKALMPVHNLCRCEPMPILGDPHGDGDPGWRLNGRDLQSIYDAAGGNGAFKLKSARFRIVDHGELGPQLVDVTREERKQRRKPAADASGVDRGDEDVVAGQR